jgi:predicted nucleic acid-binding protein
MTVTLFVSISRSKRCPVIPPKRNRKQPLGNDAEPYRRREKLEDVSLLGIDEEVCKIFGRARGRLRKAGQLIGDFDLLIAATALHYGLTVLTNNRQHFERVEGLQIESI